MEKRLIKFDKRLHDLAIKRAELDLANYNELLNKVLVNLPDFKVSEENIIKLLKNPKEVAFDELMGGKSLSISGVPIGKVKAMDLIEYPDCWIAVINAIDIFKNKLTDSGLHKGKFANDPIFARHDISDFEVVDNRFVLSKVFTKMIKDKYSLYTQNEKQNEVHDILLKIYDCFEKLKEHGVSSIPDLASIGINVTQGLHKTHVDIDPSRVLEPLI